MKKTLYILVLLTLCFGLSFAQTITSNGTGGGAWNATTTWVGGVVPTGANAVVIAGTDSVTVADPDTCSSLTLNAGARLTITSGGMPSATWTANATSTVVYSGPTTVQTASPYGNLTYATTSNGGFDGDATINGNLAIPGNTLRGISATSGTRTHTIAGNVTVSGGSARIAAVNSSSATTASCTWNIGGDVLLTDDGAESRIILFESAGPHTGTATYNITGNLTLNATDRIQFRSSSSGTSSGVGTINIKGNVTNNGRVSTPSTGNTGGTLVINLNGTTAQQWTGAFPEAFIPAIGCIVQIDNSAGVTLGSGVTVSGNDTLKLVNGKLTTTSTNLLTVSSAAGAAIVGAGATSYVDGPLAYNVASVSSTAMMFPIGKGAAYRSVTLTVTQDAATETTYLAEVFNSAPSTRTLPSGITSVSSVRYWNITKGLGAGVTNASVQLTYGADDNVGNAANLRIVKDNGAGAWENVGGTGSGTPTGTITSTTNFTAFSDFALATTTPTAVGDDALPTEFSLSQNYPNPFNPSTTIEYGIAKASHVAIKVYDALGRELAELVNTEQPAGSYSVRWNATGFTSGVYYYKLIAGDFVAMRKLMLVK